MSVRYCTVLPDETINFESNIFTDGSKIITTILSVVEELKGNEIVANRAVQTLVDLALANETTSALLTKEDYDELLGHNFVLEVEQLAGDKTDAFFNTLARIDRLIDSQNLPLSEGNVNTLRDLFDGFVYTIQTDPEKAKKVGLPELVKNLGSYVKITPQI